MRSNAVIIFAAKWILNLSQREAKSKGNTRQLIHKTYWRAAAQHSTHQLEQSHAKEKQHYDHRWYGKQTTANSGIKFKICRIKKQHCLHRFIQEQEEKFFMISAHRIVGCLQHQQKKLKRWKWWNATKSMTYVQKGIKLKDKRTVKEVIRKSGKRPSLKI